MYEIGKGLNGKDIPDHFSTETINTIVRIDKHNNVKGVLYHTNMGTQISTLPEMMAQILAAKMPEYLSGVQRSIKEVDVLDELVAFRIETLSDEILVTGGAEFTVCVVYRHKKKHPKRRRN